MVSKLFQKLVNNRIVDHLEKCGLFSDFQYGFRFSRSTADLLTVVSDRIAMAFSRSEANRAVTLDICKAFDRIWHAGLLHKLKYDEISGQIFDLISSFLSNRRLQVVLDGKASQEYPVNAGVPLRCILGPTLLLLYINDLPDIVICDIVPRRLLNCVCGVGSWVAWVAWMRGSMGAWVVWVKFWREWRGSITFWRG